MKRQSHNRTALTGVAYGKRLRWVKLSELLENVGDDDLAKLRAWEKGLNPAMKQERKRLREEDE